MLARILQTRRELSRPLSGSGFVFRRASLALDQIPMLIAAPVVRPLVNFSACSTDLQFHRRRGWRRSLQIQANVDVNNSLDSLSNRRSSIREAVHYSLRCAPCNREVHGFRLAGHRLCLCHYLTETTVIDFGSTFRISLPL